MGWELSACLKSITGCSRHERKGSQELESPSPFIKKWIDRLAPVDATSMTALDVAMGRGRHASVLAKAGFRTFGVDCDRESLAVARLRARTQGLTLRVWVADLEYDILPTSRFDVLVCTRYLQRNLFPALQRAVKPGGIVLYETFTVLQLQHETGPRSREHLLEPVELREAFAGWIVLEYEEVDRQEAVARLAARRPVKY